MLTGEKHAEKTIPEALDDLDVVIDTFKEREFQCKSQTTSPTSDVRTPVYRSDTRLKLRKKRRKTDWYTGSTPATRSDITPTGRISLSPLAAAEQQHSSEVLTQVAKDADDDDR